MSNTKISSPGSSKKTEKTAKKDPLLDMGKHIRSRKVFKTNNAVNNQLRFCLSGSPKTKTNLQESDLKSLSQRSKDIDFYLNEIDSLCKSTKFDVGVVKKDVAYLNLRFSKLTKNLKKHQDDDQGLIEQCQEFVHDRKFGSKTKQEFLFTKKLERCVTKKMLGGD